MLPIDIALFAHNEANAIRASISALSQQTLLTNNRFDVQIHVLANGCTDNTADIAKHHIGGLALRDNNRFHVHDLPMPGKSRTWNHFTHCLLRPAASFAAYIDADIQLPQSGLLEALISGLEANPGLQAFSGRPLKDIGTTRAPRGLKEKLIARSAGALDDFQTAISGSLYAVRADFARDVSMPIGLPVEDGFLRAMIVTDMLKSPEDTTRLTAKPELHHIYESLTSLRALIRHQVRLVVGTAVNAAVFEYLARECRTRRDVVTELELARADDAWLPRVIRRELPRWPFGYVPFGLLYRRISRMEMSDLRRPQSIALRMLGLPFDWLVYMLATLKLLRRQAAGFW